MSALHTGETYKEKALRKFKEQPLVPLGAAATTFALVVSMVKMRRGESRSFNNWLRVRVIAQGLTIAAVCAGTWAFGHQRSTDSTNTRILDEIQAKREEREGRERMEFEGRLKEAEEVWAVTEGQPKEKMIPSVNGLPGIATSVPVNNTPSTSEKTSLPSSSSWWRWGRGG